MSWRDGEDERGEGDLSMVRPIKRLFSKRLPALKALGLAIGGDVVSMSSSYGINAYKFKALGCVKGLRISRHSVGSSLIIAVTIAVTTYFIV